ncbi:MAG: carbon storage regulator CsrA [Clostridiaceae bacterium]
MLVISRKKNESLLIGDDIEVTVTQIENGSVKIAINAPKSVRILRKELIEAVTNENQNATMTDLNLLKHIKLNK